VKVPLLKEYKKIGRKGREPWSVYLCILFGVIYYDSITKIRYSSGKVTIVTLKKHF